MGVNLFRPGQTIKDAGLVIVSVLQAKGRSSEILYRVRYLCCGTEVDMKHNGITGKRWNRIRACMVCSRRARAEADERGIPYDQMPLLKGRRVKCSQIRDAKMWLPYGVNPPAWPVPRSDLIGVNIPNYERWES